MLCAYAGLALEDYRLADYAGRVRVRVRLRVGVRVRVRDPRGTLTRSNLWGE